MCLMTWAELYIYIYIFHCVYLKNRRKASHGGCFFRMKVMCLSWENDLGNLSRFWCEFVVSSMANNAVSMVCKVRRSECLCEHLDFSDHNY